MGSKSKWVVVGGAAAFALAPVAAIGSSSLADPDIPGTGIVVNTAQLKDRPSDSRTDRPGPAGGASGRASVDPSPANNPASPATPPASAKTRTVSPASPDDFDDDDSAKYRSSGGSGSGGAQQQADSPASPSSPVTPASPASPDSDD